MRERERERQREREREGKRERERERAWTKWYSHSYTNISMVSCLPGQPFRKSGQQIGLHLFWSVLSGLQRKSQPFREDLLWLRVSTVCLQKVLLEFV